jgi:hypothetical protein
MADKIFINYRRDDSIGMAGRLHDRLAQEFGRDNLFMDVDHIPFGVDFVVHLNNQVAACDAMLAIIGPNWLTAKDEAGQRRLDQPDDFVAIEIAVALARDIRVIPVLVDGARMPRASELPDALKPLARRHAAEVRHAHFGQDAQTLIARMRGAVGDKAVVEGGREALGDKARGPGRWRVRAVAGVAAMAVLLLGLWVATTFVGNLVERGVHEAEMKWEEERRTLMAEANRKVGESEQQRLAAAKAEQDRASGAAEAEAKRKADEAEQQRRAAVKAEQERQARAAAEAEAKRKAEPSILVINDYSITSVAFAPDGRTALSGSDNKKLKLWDLASGREIRTFTGHTDRVTSVAFAPDGRTALSGSKDDTLKLWDVASGLPGQLFLEIRPSIDLRFLGGGKWT